MEYHLVDENGKVRGTFYSREQAQQAWCVGLEIEALEDDDPLTDEVF
jgi:hypothetical protein